MRKGKEQKHSKNILGRFWSFLTSDEAAQTIALFCFSYRTTRNERTKKSRDHGGVTRLFYCIGQTHAFSAKNFFWRKSATVKIERKTVAKANK